MSNLESAKAAIEAEIARAKQGLAHFYYRIEALEKAIAHLVSVDGGVLDAQPAAAMPVAKSKAKSASKAAKAAKQPTAAKTAKIAKPAKGHNELPSTGGDYWVDLVDVEPKSASEILDAAIGKLEFTPTKEHKRKLAGRMTFALNAHVKAKKIQDSGKGRERRFFKG